MSTSDRKVRKKRRWGRIFEYTSYERNLLVGDEYNELLKELEKDYSKRKSIVVTPQEIASRRDIRVSVARSLLDDLVKKKIIKKAYSNRRVSVYAKT
ncbi:MAG: hypothetical protein EAX86_12840 [Candidatus Heimdallarchaeota archaeon]|nr:hypothetical protein [Candidatus Heimdallarchaeota archaeon]